VTLKALAELRGYLSARLILSGSMDVLCHFNRELGEPLRLQMVKSIEEDPGSDAIPVIEPEGAADFTPRIGTISSAAGRISGQGIRLGVAACLNGDADALVTAPSSKEALHLAGFKYPGQTEMISQLCGVEKSIMILTAGSLRVGMATTHLALKDVSGELSQELIEVKINTLHQTLIKLYKIENPRLAVASLNPHASDGGIFGDEEEKIITPAIEHANRSGIRVEGPFPADTLFPRFKDYDGILAMYHDQGMIPVKMAGFGTAINLTGGLPFPRTSPDHGTAFDIAGKLVANPGSMIEAIKAAVDFVSGKVTRK